MSTKDEIRTASRRFYDGLNRMANGERGALADSWSHGTSVTTMHPIGGRQVGWDAVRKSFDQVAEISDKGKIRLKDQRIEVVGDLAYEIGIEEGDLTMGGHRAELEHRVTNIYRRESGEWKMVHHHTDTSPAMLDVLARLQSPAA
jgi:ketosteroid isomerase-like protein